MKRVSFPRFRIRSVRSKKELTKTDFTLDHLTKGVTGRSLTFSNYFHVVMPWMRWLTVLFVLAACWGVVILIAIYWFRIILPITLAVLAGYCIIKAISLLLTFLE